MKSNQVKIKTTVIQDDKILKLKVESQRYILFCSISI